MPRARCAHQVVYDTTTKTVYMHGGNAGITASGVDAAIAKAELPRREETRLDDFWSMTLERKVVLLMRVDVLKADTLNLQTLTRRDSEKSTIRDSSATVSLGGE